MIYWFDLLPTTEEVRTLRESSGEGMMGCRRKLTLERMEGALALLDEGKMTETEATIVAVLKCMLRETHT